LAAQKKVEKYRDTWRRTGERLSNVFLQDLRAQTFSGADPDPKVGGRERRHTLRFRLDKTNQI